MTMTTQPHLFDIEDKTCNGFAGSEHRAIAKLDGVGAVAVTLQSGLAAVQISSYDVVGAAELSCATLRKMHQNLWWAARYRLIAFPLAAGVLYPFTLSPEVAALSTSGSSAVVAVNASLLKRTKLAGIESPRRKSDEAEAMPDATGAPA